MSPFTKISLSNPSNAKALIFSLLACVLFIVFLSAVFPRSVRKKKSPTINHLTIPTPLTPAKLLEEQPRPVVDINAQFRVVPEHFKKVDFHYHSYGLYTLPNGRQIDLTLYGSDLFLPNRSGWFSLRDIHYKDVTGDRKAEAIVRLWHVKCDGRSCDGGTDLFYIYALRNGKLKPIWQFETGSYEKGCGLKSLIINEKQLVVELFGWCPKPAEDYPDPSKFVVKDLTYMLFTFEGGRFNRKTIEFVPTPSTSVKHYQSSIHFY